MSRKAWADVKYLIEQLQKEKEELIKALEFYADKNTYIPQIDYDENWKPIRSYNPIGQGDNCGDRAREVLDRIK